MLTELFPLFDWREFVRIATLDSRELRVDSLWGILWVYCFKIMGNCG